MTSSKFRCCSWFKRDGLALAGLAMLSTGASALASDLSFHIDDLSLVPDGNSAGVVSVAHLPAIDGRIADVDITLNIAGLSPGGWNGDLYVLVSHAGAASVLVNRPGLTASNPFGYGDNGLSNVRFDDDAGTGDFHRYQSVLNVSQDSELPITGVWEPDGRGADPDDVLSTSARSRFLSAFDGLAASGEWRLFVADLSLGAKFQIQSWDIHLTIEAIPVPETSRGLALASVTLAGLTALRWYRRRS